MGIADRIRDLTKKAQDTAVEHEDQIHEAVQKAQVAADQRTGGQYHDKIARAAEKADAYVSGLRPEDPAAEAPAAPTETPPAAPVTPRPGA